MRRIADWRDYRLYLVNVCGQILARLRGRADSEHEQAVIRIVIVGLLFLAFWWLGALDHFDAGVRTSAWLAAGYFVCSISYLVAIIAWPEVSPTRRVCAIFTDLGTTSAFMHFGGEAAAPFYAIYLWVTLGNGFRYGLSYLAVSVLVGAGGFLLVILYTDFWRAQLPLGLGLLAALIMLPGYSASLIRKLRDAKQQADAANLAKGRFLATMSHELRTPLNAIIGMSQLLTGTRLDADQREMVHTVRSSGGTLLSMIEDILDLSRIEAEKLTLISREFDLHKTLGEIFIMFRAQAASKGLAFLFRLDADVPRQLRGDVVRLRQILINLVANALKFTEHGRVIVAVRCAGPANAEIACLQFQVIDSGIGIPPEYQGTIFDRFTQAPQSLERGRSGSGLGLAISRGLVRAMGGHISVTSNTDLGSTFTVELSLTRSRSTAAEPLPQSVVVLGDAQFSEQVTSALSALIPIICTNSPEAARLAFANSPSKQTLLLIDMRSAKSRRAAALLSADAALSGAGGVIFTNESEDDGAALSWSCIIMLRERRDMETDAERWKAFSGEALVAALQAAAALNDLDADALTSDEQCLPQHPALRVLVAEDNPVNQKVTRRLLERAGHTVFVVDNGEDALDALDEQPFHAFIVDVNMARLAGLDAVKLHRMGALGQPRLPIIALSADATAETRRAAEDAGVDVYLTKPVDPRRLLDTFGVAVLQGGWKGSCVIQHCAGRRRHPGSPMHFDTSPLRAGNGTCHRLGAIQTLARYTDSDFVVATLEEYLTNAERLIDEIAGAIRNGDTMLFRDRLHALRGTSGNVGATAICRLCREYHGITDQRLAESGPAILRRLSDSLQRFREEFVKGAETLRSGRQG
ncbi:MAG: response regulator [Rhodospirillales bacterium]|nr:response regulator [Rhodospirillales bacterium]